MIVDPLSFEYDGGRDVLTVEGIQYSGDLFRSLGLLPLHPDEIVKIISRQDGMVTIQTVRDRELAHRFDLVARAGISG